MTNSQKLLLGGGCALLFIGLLLLAYAVWNPGQRFRVESAMIRLREADSYLKQNTAEAPREALSIFTKVLAEQVDPEISQMARYGMALALEKNQDFGGAMEQYEILNRLELEPEMRRRIDFSMGKMLLMVNHEAEGLSKFQLLLARSEDEKLKGKIHSILGAFYLRKGDFQRSRENFSVALKYDADNIQAELGRADALKQKGDSPVALEYYQEYLFGSGNLNPLQREKVLEKVRRDAFDEALAALRSGKYESALSGFKNTLEAESDKTVREHALYYMGEAELGMRRPEKAIELFNGVIENASPEMDQAALIKIGQIHFEKGEYQKASAIFLKAEKDFPSGSYTSSAREWKREAEDMQQDLQLYRRPDGFPAP